EASLPRAPAHGLLHLPERQPPGTEAALTIGRPEQWPRLLIAHRQPDPKRLAAPGRQVRGLRRASGAAYPECRRVRSVVFEVQRHGFTGAQPGAIEDREERRVPAA